MLGDVGGGLPEDLLEFMGFIRLRVCVYVTSIAVFGFLLFNPVSLKLFLVMFVATYGLVGTRLHTRR